MSLHLDGVSLNLGGTPVLRELTLHLAQGEQAALIGPSGAGKSLTLQAIAQLASVFSILPFLSAAADMATFFAVLLVGFAYVWNRGDLDWVRATSTGRGGKE